MIEHEMLSDKGGLIVRPKGPLPVDDFSSLTLDRDACIKGGCLNGLIIGGRSRSVKG